MAYLTIGAVKAAAVQQGVRSTKVAEAQFQKAAGAPLTTNYDIFLSHSFMDADTIAGIAAILEAEGQRVFVDWIEDPQADRSRVTSSTAKMLRERMRRSNSLIYASSAASSNSKWMPWELGYFDGFRPGYVAILPLVQTAGGSFSGQEYLGLYPYMEHLTIDGRPRLGIMLKANTAQTLEGFTRRGV